MFIHMAKPSFHRIVSRAPSSHEDRLTEIVALVMDASPALSSEIAHTMAGANQAADWRITTQRRVSSESRRRVDLVLESEVESHVIWVEAKLDAREGEDQLEDYFEGLRKTETFNRRSLVYLTREGASGWRIDELRKECDPDKVGSPVELVAFDWQRLASVLDRLDSSQPEFALAPYLRRYLDSEGAIVRKVDPEIIAVAKGFSDAHSSLKQLLGNISDQVASETDLPEYERWPRTRIWDDFPKWFRTYRLEGSESVLEAPLVLEWTLRILDEDRPGNEEPVFCWGLTLKGALFEEVAPGLLKPMQALSPDYENFLDDGCDRLFKVEPLANVGFNRSVEEQALFMSTKIVEGLNETRAVAQVWIQKQLNEQSEAGR